MTYPTPSERYAGEAATARFQRLAADGMIVTPPTITPHVQPVVVTHEVVTDATRYTWEIVLDAIKNIVVIVTCLAVLYTLYVAYSALDSIGDQLSSITG